MIIEKVITRLHKKTPTKPMQLYSNEISLFARYEIILANYEIKSAFSYCEAIFHTGRVFHSEAISLAIGKFH